MSPLLSFFKSRFSPIFTQDEAALDRIKRRKLLDRDQASLAVFFGLGSDVSRLLTLEMRLVFRCLPRNDNSVSLRSLQRRRMKFLQRQRP